MNKEQFTLEYKAPNRFPSTCFITVYRDIPLVIASETGVGMSVTNAAELIATEVVNRCKLDPVRLLFVEHYPESQRPKPYGESFDLVTFTWDGTTARNPDWRNLPNDEFEQILQAINV
ncbi:hypothetical protein F5984_24545 [Rudanella paleaurantiibacter]|uniref:Uncharacterized protein n=1 Tax=Rudanella paleaurantiibacter TaxID=2614655 RepID=A0A7J5TSU5_9BACT|nr:MULTISPECIES: hypothetical protein [Rudanella]KAB7726488.1 hypothetical protein F5984_24545 [Rudanella paleaurantiibacter]